MSRLSLHEYLNRFFSISGHDIHIRAYVYFMTDKRKDKTDIIADHDVKTGRMSSGRQYSIETTETKIIKVQIGTTWASSRG